MGHLLKFLLITLLCGMTAKAQIVLTLNESTSFPTSALGMGHYSGRYYDTLGQKNLIAQNDPSFQSQQFRFVENIASGTTTSFTTLNTYDVMPANWAIGATVSVVCNTGLGVTCSGGATGCTGTVTGNTAAVNGSSGPAITFTPACGTAINSTNTVYLTKSGTGNAAETNWNTYSGGSSTAQIDSTPADQAPAISPFPAPTQCYQVTVPAGQAIQVKTFIDGGDSTEHFTEYSLTGTYTQGAWFSVQSGTGWTVNFNTVRFGTGTTPVNGTVPISGGWANYSVNSQAYTPETIPQAANAIQVSYTITNGGSSTGNVCMGRAYLNATSDTNPSPMRDQWVNDLATFHAGEVRWNGVNSTNGCTLLNWLTPQADRAPCEGLANSNYTVQQGTPYGLHEFLQGVAAAGVKKVSFTIPPTWSNAELNNLADYLGGTTGYAAYRIALGQTAPWTTVFQKIVIENGNETWNTVFPGSSYQPIQNYIPLSVIAATTLKSNANWNPSVEKFAVDVQQVQPSAFISLVNGADTTGKIDYLSTSNYSLEGALTNCSQPQLDIDAWTEAYSWSHDTSNAVYQYANYSRPIHVYEGNAAPYGTNICTQAQINGWPEGEGYALALVRGRAYLQQQFPGHVLDDNIWEQSQLSIPTASSSTGTTANLWGLRPGIGGSNYWQRPAWYAISAFNACAGLGTGYTPSTSGIPLVNHGASNNIPAQTNVPTLDVFKYGSGTQRCVVVVNSDATSSQTYTFAGTNAPTGTVTKTLYTSPNVNDSNETNHTLVGLATSTLSNPIGDTLQPHSMATYSYTTGTAGQIFTLACITAVSITIAPGTTIICH